MEKIRKLAYYSCTRLLRLKFSRVMVLLFYGISVCQYVVDSAAKETIFNSNCHSFYDLDFLVKSHLISFFVAKFYFPSQTPENYFKFHLSLISMLVINFIFYANYLIICLKNSFFIHRTSIFCP